MSLISTITAYSYTDQISALAVAKSPYNNSGNSYTVLYVGTSNGNIYVYNELEDTIAMQRVVPTGYVGSLSGEITGLTVDPNGKYLYINAPYDNHCLRISIASIDLTSPLPVLTVPIDRDIYRFGDNTGNIIVDSQGVVYIITQRGQTISTIENYGSSFINSFFSNQGPTLNFKGIALSPNEQRIYASEFNFGNIYYYDFLSNQPTFNIINSRGIQTGLRAIVTSGNNIFYTQKDSVYADNKYLNTIVRVVGSGINAYVPTTDPQKFTLFKTNALAVNDVGDIYISASNNFNQSTLYKVSFGLIPRNNYQAPPPRQQIPILQPYPTTSCKRIVEPFNPRLRFGWGLTNTKKPPILDVRKSPLCCPPPIVNCPVTPFYCLPAPPPVVPPQPVAPIYPTTVTTRQLGDHFLSSGFRNSVVAESQYLLSTSLALSTSNTRTLPAIGPLGEVYYMTQGGTLLKIYNNQIVWRFATGSAVNNGGPVVSPTGAIVFATDAGSLYRLDSNATVLGGYPVRLGQGVLGTPLSITNGSFDYVFCAYGNTIGAFQASNAGVVWTGTTQRNGELFRSSVSTDGINIFVGTDQANVYCYVAQTGYLNWVYNTNTTGKYVFTPYLTASNIGITVQNDNNIFILNNTTVRTTGLDLYIQYPGISVVSPPVLSTDPTGNLWAHVIAGNANNEQLLYAFGGINASGALGGQGAYTTVWSSPPSEKIPLSLQAPVVDSSGFVYVSSVSGTVNQYNAYYRGGATQSYVSRLILNGQTTGLVPIQVFTTPLITGQNTMYVFGSNASNQTTFMYTISG